MESVVVLAMVVLGGMGNIPGVILGAVILFLTPEVLRDVVNPLQDKLVDMHILADKVVNPENLRMLLFALALIFVMLVRPEGLWPSKQRRAELHDNDKPAPDTEPTTDKKEAANG
jgi:branched-chain amino acid transport system permease protein